MVERLAEHETDPWFKAMVGAIRDRLVDSDDAAFCGLEYLLYINEDTTSDLWAVDFYPYPVALEDEDEGDVLVLPQFSIDLRAFCEIFEEISEFRFNPNDDQNAGLMQGTHLQLTGKYAGHNVAIRIYAESHSEEKPVLRIRQDGSHELLDQEDGLDGPAYD